MRILIIAPHPDDEVLGCGGTIAKFAAEKHEVTVAIMTKAKPPLFSEDYIAQGRREAKEAHKLLGVKETIFLDLPAAELDLTSHGLVNQAISKLLNDIKPDMMFVPFVGDLHLDHQRLFISSLVAARPISKTYPRKVLAYETVSETNWNAPYLAPGFHPTVYIDISDFLKQKLQAFATFKSQVKQFPHERSIEALDALAKLRGATVYCHAAEAFVLIREVID